MKDTEFEIYHDDTLTNERDTLRELNSAKKPSFGAIVANPRLMSASHSSCAQMNVTLQPSVLRWARQRAAVDSRPTTRTIVSVNSTVILSELQAKAPAIAREAEKQGALYRAGLAGHYGAMAEE